MSDKIKPAYYAIIPANVRYDADLKPNAKLLYGEITALCNERGYCWAGNEYFAKLYKVGQKTVSDWISSLVKQGYLTRELVYKENSKEIEARILRIPAPYPLPLKKEIPYPEKNGEVKTTKKQDTETESDITTLSIKKGIPPLKNTEDNITNDYINEVFNNEDLKKYSDFIPLVEKWVKYKKIEKKQQYKTADTLKAWIKKLIKYSGGNFKNAEDIVETAMANLWEGIHETNNKKNRPVTLRFESQNSITGTLSAPAKYGGF